MEAAASSAKVNGEAKMESRSAARVIVFIDLRNSITPMISAEL
jgi:hypothetical protein